MLKNFDIKGKLAKSTLLFQTVFGYSFDDLMPDNPTGFDSLLEFVRNTINLTIAIAGLLAVIILIYNGILYILSGGDEGKVEQATRGITYAIIGLILCFISIIVVDFILDQVLRAGV